jgi:hypothetical protein
MGFNLTECIIIKMENVWATLHPLQEGESIVNLAYYNTIMSNDDII